MYIYTYVIRVYSLFNIIVFVTVRGPLGRKQRVKEDSAFIFRNTVWSAKWHQRFPGTMKTEALHGAETLLGLPTYKTVRCHNPEDWNIYVYTTLKTGDMAK